VIGQIHRHLGLSGCLHDPALSPAAQPRRLAPARQLA
jgi:hypothetical protein